MKLGKEIRQLRKLSGMTQEQLAEKLNVSRQALSKWENDSSTPDLDSIVKISVLFQIPLDELLSEEMKRLEEKPTQITLEDLTKIHEHNRKMNVLLLGGIFFVAVSVMMGSIMFALETITVRTTYILYRYMTVGNYVSAPINYDMLKIPGIVMGVIGLILCAVYWLKSSGYVRRHSVRFLSGQKSQDTAGEGESRIKGKRKFVWWTVVLPVCALAVLVFASVFGAKVYKAGNDAKHEAYTDFGIQDLQDDEQWAMVDIGEENEVLLVSNNTYEDGNGNNASIFCQVYYSIDGKTYDLGTIESQSTAYPVSYGEKCLYTASNGSFETYVIDSVNHKLILKTQYKADYSEDGSGAFYCVEGGVETPISEEEFWDSYEIYAEGTVVQFAYGLSDRS